MFVLMLLLVIVPGVFINVWLTRREQAKKQRGFEVKLNTGETPVPLREKDNDHG
jgi:hypothetical protein